MDVGFNSPSKSGTMSALAGYSRVWFFLLIEHFVLKVEKQENQTRDGELLYPGITAIM